MYTAAAAAAAAAVLDAEARHIQHKVNCAQKKRITGESEKAVQQPQQRKVRKKSLLFI